jgi:Methyltransferase domain
VGDREIWVSENQRLKEQLKTLHARVAALESSRWWRLHPRFVMARLLRPFTSSDHTEAGASKVSGAGKEAASEVAERFRSEIVEEGDFSEDWFTVYIPIWDRILGELQGRRARVLEVGSFEGLSACFILWRLPDAQLTCIDTFAGIPVYQAYGIGGPELEERFDHNVALVEASRVRKCVGRSHQVLSDLLAAEEFFDLIYIDASHRALDVLADAALCWQLLAVNGLVIFDDYGVVPAGVEPLEHPTAAIDAFRSLLGDQFEVVNDERQLIVRKRA